MTVRYEVTAVAATGQVQVREVLEGWPTTGAVLTMGPQTARALAAKLTDAADWAEELQRQAAMDAEESAA